MPDPIWTIAHTGGASGSAEALGVSVATLEMASMAASKLTLEIEGNMDATSPAFIEGNALSVERSGQPFFTGTVTRAPRAGGGSGEGRAVVVEGPLWWLGETMYLQEVWHRVTGASGDIKVWQPRVLLNAKRDGTRRTTAEQIGDLLDYAVAAGAPMAKGTINLPAITPVAQVATDLTVLEAIRRQLAWHPDAVLYEDHSVSPPTVNVVQASALTAVSQNVAGLASSGRETSDFQIEKLPFRKPSRVALFYERLHDTDGRTYREVVRDIYPAGEPLEPGALCVTIPLQGSRKTTQKQTITTRTYPTTKAECEATSGQNWWAAKEPALDAVKSVLKFDDVKVGFTDANPPARPDPIGDPGPPPPVPPPPLTPANVPRELVAGSISEWMKVETAGVTVTARMAAPLSAINALAAPERRRLLALLPERIVAAGGSIWAATTMSASFTATDALTKVYSRLSSTSGAEPVPEGIAAHVYNSLSGDAYSGSIIVHEDEAGSVAWMGKRITFAGQLSAWSTAIMPVQSVSMDLQAGSTTLSFGPPAQLGPVDLVAILQGLRRRETISNFTENDAEDRDTPDTVIGPSDSPVSNAISSAPAAPGLFAAAKAILNGTEGVSVAAGMVARYGPSGSAEFPVAAKNFDAGDGVIYVTINTDKHQKITSVEALSKASSLPASTPARRPNTTEPGDAGQDGTLHIAIAQISGGEVEQKAGGLILVAEASPRSLYNLVNKAGSGARIYDDSAGTGTPSNGEFQLRRIVAGTSSGGVELTITENASDIEISAELTAPPPSGGVTGIFTWLDHVATPHTLEFEDGLLVDATVNGSPSTGWTLYTE
jgi:hypothetical protein